jgi:iron complex outermembrane receptor protein
MKNQLFIIFCLAARTVCAADQASESDYYQELPVVLSASRLSQPLSEAPNAMTVIDRNMIIASGFRTITDLFKLVPGMYVSYYKSGQAVVSYHGSTDQYARRMQVMIDGRSVYMPPLSMVNWAALPITVDDIERIEVIRGPAAASYGANSTQGVISITTRDAGVMGGQSISVTKGDKGVNDVSARFGRRGELLDYRMTLAYTADNGYDSLAVPPNNIPATQFKAVGLLGNSNDSNQARMLNYRADYHPNAVDRYDIQFGFNKDVQGVGFNDKNPNSGNGFKGTNTNTFHDLTGLSDYLQLGWIRSLDDNAELSVRYAHSREDQQEALPVYLVGTYYPGPITQSLKTRRDEIEVQHTVPFSAVNRLVYGASYRTDQVNGQGYVQGLPTPVYLFYGLSPANPSYSSSTSISQYTVFAHDEWRITPRWLFNAGTLFERDATGTPHNSPRVALNFHVTPQQTLRMGVSVAYRTPSLVETHYPALQPGALFIPNQKVISPGLLSEKIVSHEIGYLGEFPQLATSLDLRLFSDQLSRGIYVSTTSNTFVNGLSGNYQGFEATLKHEFSERGNLTVNFAHELAASNGAALAAAGQKIMISNNPLNADILSASTPRNSGSVLYSQRLAYDYSFSAAYYRQDAMQPFDRGLIDYQPIQRRMDVRLAKSFNLAGGVKGNLALVLQNLLGQGYTEYVASNLFNRRGYITLALNW